MTGTVYRPSTVKRVRRSNAQLDVIHDAVYESLKDEHPATLRGTFYRVMSAGAVEKSEAGYKLVGREVLKMRRAGLLPYSWITDGTRYIIKPDTWTDLDEMLSDARASYRRALWHQQLVEVHIFTEKDAIVGVISSVTSAWDVPVGVMRGYASESFCYEVGARARGGWKPTFFYQLGDHDPSGVDAWRVFEDRVRGFAPDAALTFERIAVTPEQIDTLQLPTRPTKRTDSRATGFGDARSVEVDAIPANVLRGIVRDAITRHIDQEILELTRRVEQEEREVLSRIVGVGDDEFDDDPEDQPGR